MIINLIVKNNEMNIVFICPPAFPDGGACANILDKILNCYQNKNRDNYCVLTYKRNITESSSEIKNGIAIERVLLWERLLKQEVYSIIKKGHFKFSDLLHYYIKKGKDKLHIKETGYSSYIKMKITDRLESINSGKIDLIVAVSGIFDAIYAANQYCKVHPETKLIFYQLDPLSTNHIENKANQNARKQCEKEAYEIATAIITTPLIYDDVIELYPRNILNKVYPIELPNVDTAHYYSNERIVDRDFSVCVYTGMFYPGFRDPDFAVSVFERFKQNMGIRFWIVGANRNSLSTDTELINTVFEGKKSLEECREYIRKADFLVNIGNQITNQTPSKLFDYISTGKPIINICQDESCPSIKYLQEYPLSITVVFEHDSVDDAAQKINEFIQKNKGKKVGKDYIDKHYEKFSTDYCCNKIFGIINGVLAGED